ncbi:hypothetical protein [Streptomyces sp. NPDC001348]
MNGGTAPAPEGAGPAAGGSVLPAIPALPGFAALSRRLTDLGFRHAAEPLLLAPRPGPAPPAAKGTGTPTFRVLDGLWLSGRGGNWQRVDSAFLNDCRRRWEGSGDPRADSVRGLLNRLRRRTRGDAMHLRRIVLYQLACLLTDRAGGPTREAAEALGVDPAESAALCAAVAAGFPPNGPARQACEQITDALLAGRLHRATRLTALLPDRPDDPALAATLAELRRRTTAARSLMATAARRQAAGRSEPAAQAWLGAARIAVDDPRARAGLLGAAALLADSCGPGGGPVLHTGLDEDTVTLEWQPVGAAGRRRGPARYSVVRFPEGAPEQAVEIASAGSAGTVLDTAVPVATRLRYAVVPLYGDRAAGVPSVSGVVLSVPEVRDLTWKAVPDGVSLGWQAHRKAAGVRVRRGTRPPVPGGRAGLVDRPLPAGDHSYRVSSGYRAPTGELLWSPGRTVSVRAEEWPSLVPEMSVDRIHDDGRVEIVWTPPERGSEHLVPWTLWPVAPGEDVTDLYAALPPLGGPAAGGQDGASGRRRVTLRPSRGAATRVTAVSVMSGRAVAGPSVLIEAPEEVTGLAVDRTGADAARVRFRWPDPAVLVLVRWEQRGRVRERRVARSLMGPHGVEIPLSPDEAVVTVGAVPRPDATVVAAVPARRTVPAAPPPSPSPPSAPPPSAPPPPVTGGGTTPPAPVPPRAAGGRPPSTRRLPWWRRLWPWRRARRG